MTEEANARFFAFSIETTGALSPDARKFISLVFSELPNVCRAFKHNPINWSADTLQSSFSQRLSITLQEGMAASALAAIARAKRN